MKITIEKDFTDTPGGRNKEQSEYSGEEFRERILIPKFNECLKNNEKLVVDLDNTYGYPTSFLDEAFGKLVKEFTDEQLKNIEYISKDEPNLIIDIKKYMENNR